MSENNVDNNGIPGRNGGVLNRGGTPGNKGGTGRPKSEVRQACVEGFESALPVLMRIAMDDNIVSQAERLKAIDLLGKYGGLQQVDQTSGDQPLKPTSVVTIGSDVPLSDVLAAIEKLEG